MGFPHEHMRREIVGKLDIDKTLRFYADTQGWTKEEVYRQVLTPLEDSSIFGTTNTDSESIMCYQMPGTITKDGNTVIGGSDINEQDYEFAGKVYPKS